MANPPFIPNDLDDAGLVPAEFRIFCRLARRGNCTESIRNMAKGCRMHPDTVWDALRRLIRLRMVTRARRPGATSIHRITPSSAWTPTGNEGAPETKGHPLKAAGGTGNEGVGTHRKLRGTKCPLNEVSSKKAGNTPPVNGEKSKISPNVALIALNNVKRDLRERIQRTRDAIDGMPRGPERDKKREKLFADKAKLANAEDQEQELLNLGEKPRYEKHKTETM